MTKNSYQAFTLLEIIIVIAIIGIISFFSVASFTTKTDKSILENQVTLLEVVLDEAKSQAASGNARECQATEVLSSIQVHKSSANTLEVRKICKDRITDAPSAAITTSRHTLTKGVRFLTPDASPIVEYKSGGYGEIPAASTQRLLHTSNLKYCACLRFATDGSHTKDSNCRVTSVGVGSCL